MGAKSSTIPQGQDPRKSQFLKILHLGSQTFIQGRAWETPPQVGTAPQAPGHRHCCSGAGCRLGTSRLPALPDWLCAHKVSTHLPSAWRQEVQALLSPPLQAAAARRSRVQGWVRPETVLSQPRKPHILVF